MSSVPALKYVQGYAPPPPDETNTRIWTGTGFSPSASLASNWSPTGAPQPGDKLEMHSGVMDISGNALNDDFLSLGVPNLPTSIELNLSNQASVRLEPVADAEPDVTVSIGANDVGHVILSDGGVESGASYLFSLGIDASLESDFHFDLTTADAIISGGPGMRFINAGEVTLHDSELVVFGDVVGSGTMTVGDTQLGRSFVDIDGMVSSGQTFDVVGSVTSNASSILALGEPTSYTGHVTLDFASLWLDGVNADSYSLGNNLLSLYSKGRVVDTVQLTTAGPDRLKVYQTSTGVQIDNSNHGSGTLLPLHFVATPTGG
jgi:hypothetical protein